MAFMLSMRQVSTFLTSDNNIMLCVYILTSAYVAPSETQREIHILNVIVVWCSYHTQNVCWNNVSNFGEWMNEKMAWEGGEGALIT